MCYEKLAGNDRSLDTEERKMTEPLISIIVPVYRVESYLSRCVDSLSKIPIAPKIKTRYHELPVCGSFFWLGLAERVETIPQTKRNTMAEYSWFQKRDIAIIAQGFCLELLYLDACGEATKFTLDS